MSDRLAKGTIFEAFAMSYFALYKYVTSEMTVERIRRGKACIGALSRLLLILTMV